MEGKLRRLGTSLEAQVEQCYGLQDVALEDLKVAVNDVFAVTTPHGRFALKLYHRHPRDIADVQWELDLVLHLVKRGAPVVEPVAGHRGYVESFWLDGRERVGALFVWADGGTPKPDHSTYVLLGRAAAQIHQAADTFTSPLPRHRYDYDADVLIDDQLRRMERHLTEAKRWHEIVALGERLKQSLAQPGLDRGVCHMDLTLGNVHQSGPTIAVFDFDSAGRCWRAHEPYGVLRFSAAYFLDWLAGYRSIRPFGEADERAVPAFAIVGDLRIVAWKLGVAESSRSAPRLTADDLPSVVDGWLAWERQHLPGRP